MIMNIDEKIGKAIIELLKGFLIVIITSVFSLLMAWPIKWTWNYTMPYIFSLPTITWGKSWCLFFLSNCLIRRWPHTDKKGE